MKPLPAQPSIVLKATDSAMPSIPQILANPAAAYSNSNRRAATCSVQQVYPWLLFTSTAVAALFCLMYITKPVILAPQGSIPGYTPPALPPISKDSPASPTSLLPSHDRLPGEISSPPASATAGRDAIPQAHTNGPFEQTNLRVQHILTAEAPGGHLAKIDLDVPVLYQSRNLRWTPAEVAGARELLVRLANYQEKCQTLRAEGTELLESWNHLVSRSIPTPDLRADSPTLPTNQLDAADAPLPAGLNTTESIKIQAAGK